MKHHLEAQEGYVYVSSNTNEIYERPILKMIEKNGQPLRDMVFDTLRDAIVNGLLRPGERLMEVKIAEELEVSRTPVRESIQMLESEGLVHNVPRKGAYVTPISIKDLHEMMQIRRALETLVAELAANQATVADIETLRVSNNGFERAARENDPEGVVANDQVFHETLYKAAHNDRLYTLIHGLREQMQRLRMEYVQTIDDKLHLIGQHQAIIDSIAAGDTIAARRHADAHIRQAESDMIDVLSKYDRYSEQRIDAISNGNNLHASNPLTD